MTNHVIRDAHPADIAFIYSTWLRSYRNDSLIGLSVKKSIFFETYRLVLDQILAKNTTKVLVACLPEDDSVILGYLVADPTEKVLHYIFVKDAFRRFHIAQTLYDKVFSEMGEGVVSITHSTHHVKNFIEKFTYNPFLLYQTPKEI